MSVDDEDRVKGEGEGFAGMYWSRESREPELELEDVRGCRERDWAYSTDVGVIYALAGAGLAGVCAPWDEESSVGDEGDDLELREDIRFMLDGGSDLERIDDGAGRPEGVEDVDPDRFRVARILCGCV